MAFTVDTAAQFFRTEDFGVAASWTPSAGGATQNANVILDAPDLDVLDGLAVSRDYAMTYASGSFANLTDGEAVTVAGVAYRVRGEPHQLGDGALTRAALART